MFVWNALIWVRGPCTTNIWISWFIGIKAHYTVSSLKPNFTFFSLVCFNHLFSADTTMYRKLIFIYLPIKLHWGTLLYLLCEQPPTHVRFCQIGWHRSSQMPTSRCRNTINYLQLWWYLYPWCVGRTGRTDPFFTSFFLYFCAYL